MELLDVCEGVAVLVCGHKDLGAQVPRLRYAWASRSTRSTSDKAKRTPRPRSETLILPALRQRRRVMGVTFQRAARSAGVRKIGE